MTESSTSWEAVNRLTCDVQSVVRLLLSPDSVSLEAATARLESAVNDLRRFVLELEAGRIEPGPASDLQVLAAGLRRSRLLLENASGFHGRRIACLSAALEGYQCGGAPAPLAAGNRMAIHG